MFSRGPSLQLRLFLAVIVAIGVIVADSRMGAFSQIRTYMDTAVSPFYFLANGPRQILDNVLKHWPPASSSSWKIKPYSVN
ncbi:Rod shape-determining protein MreC [Klebsiella pneumoniae]|nr:Rod shape-determining protein MreC [Klebsiella pneumoniae]